MIGTPTSKPNNPNPFLVTTKSALRLTAFFGTTSGFWLCLQTDYDTEEAAQELSGVLAQIHRFELLSA